MNRGVELTTYPASARDERLSRLARKAARGAPFPPLALWALRAGLPGISGARYFEGVRADTSIGTRDAWLVNDGRIIEPDKQPMRDPRGEYQPFDAAGLDAHEAMGALELVSEARLRLWPRVSVVLWNDAVTHFRAGDVGAFFGTASSDYYGGLLEQNATTLRDAGLYEKAWLVVYQSAKGGAEGSADSAGQPTRGPRSRPPPRSLGRSARRRPYHALSRGVRK